MSFLQRLGRAATVDSGEAGLGETKEQEKVVACAGSQDSGGSGLLGLG